MSRGRGETARRGLEIFKIRNPQLSSLCLVPLLKNPQPYIYVQLGVMINKVTLYVTLTL
jgi:hypothetical protein